MDFIYLIFGTPLGWVMRFCYDILHNYALALVVFTLLTKFLLFPLGIKQQKTTLKIARVRPKMQELQLKYKNNPEKLRQEQAELYRREKISMGASCLPLLIQFPVLFGVIDVVYKPLTHILGLSDVLINRGVEIANAVLNPALINQYSPQLTLVKGIQMMPEQFSELGSEFVTSVQNLKLSLFGLDLTAIPKLEFSILLLIPIISAVASFASSLLTRKLTSAANGGQMGAGSNILMLLIMPVFSFYLAFQVPAGVGFYWAISYIFQMVQQLILNKMYNPSKVMEEVRKEEERMKQLEKEKRTLKIVTTDADGNEIEKQKIISEKEMNKIRLAEARRRDALKYGEEYNESSD